MATLLFGIIRGEWREDNMKIGMYGGKFLPLHMGHVYSITKAACMVDELYVVLSYSKIRDELFVQKGNIKPLPYSLRYRWLKQLTKDMENVTVIAVEDTADSDESYDWEQGAADIKRAIGKEIDVVFGSEESYRETFQSLYPNATYTLIDANRDLYPISATRIRQDGPFQHWEYIPDVAKSYFVKKVVLVGTESCGKSTLTRYLAKLFNTSYVEEYGRTVCDRLGGSEGVLTKEDYYHIAYGHKMKEQEAIEKANKVVFIDTEAIVTQFFAGLYQREQYPVLDEIAKIQDYDLYLLLEPDVTWVDDGTRHHGDERVRKENHARLKELLDQQGVTYITISGDYEERLSSALHQIKKIMK